MSQTRLNVAQLKTLGHDDVATDAEVSAAIYEHLQNSDPHPQYLTNAEAELLFGEGTDVGDEKIVNRGIPGGYAPLDASGLIPTAAIPVQTVVTIVQAMSMDGGTY